MIKTYALINILAPLLGSLVAGLAAKRIGRVGAHLVTIALMLVSFLAAVKIAIDVFYFNQTFYGTIYTWAASGSFKFNIGLMIDHLTAVMLLVVTFVSTLVHIYSMGYMREDPGYQRFFCYVSLFTFMMLMLVTSNNFLQIFFGWEGVGLVSYLLIGFWFTKESAVQGSLKAFLVNRVGDFGFILGIAAILDNYGSLDYKHTFTQAIAHAGQTISIFSGVHWHLDTVICILLFIGAMGKSAQVPLHVWLPESMEGPTPISALIHAATMVTAGVFMVARMSPLFELSVPALSLVLVVGATGALFLGILAFVENDIKRVIAYSTMSQLGYMMAANGASAYAAGIFHLAMHACFKALLFLSAGSVIVAMHHIQDMRKMGGLRRYLPVTYVCFFIGAMALSAFPPFSGYYSKDAIIEAVHLSSTPGAFYAYVCLLLGAFVTAYYIFRAFFMTFHGTERFDDSVRSHLKEYPSMLTAMVMLAIPSVIAGIFLIKPMLFSNPNLLGSSITVLPQHNVLAALSTHFKGVWQYTLHSVETLPFWLVISGIFMAWFNTLVCPQFPAWLARRFSWLRLILVEQFGFDRFNEWFFGKGSKRLSGFLFKYADIKMIDYGMVEGSGRGVSRMSFWLRRLQTGYLYHYVLVMVLGLLGLLLWMLF